MLIIALIIITMFIFYIGIVPEPYNDPALIASAVALVLLAVVTLFKRKK